MEKLTDFNIEKTTAEVIMLKEKLQENIKELNKYGITMEDILKKLEDEPNE